MPSFKWSFVVQSDAIDSQGHVNNVSYVQWMQDTAIKHTQSVQADQIAARLSTMWVVRRHEIEYLRQVFLGDELQIETYIDEIQRATSVRRYVFTNAKTGKTVAQGKTDWVCLDTQTGRPCSIPDEILHAFGFTPETQK